MIPIDPEETVRVTLMIRPRSPLDPDRVEELARRPVADRQYPSRAEYAESHGADPADLLAIESFAKSHALAVESSSAPLRSVVLSGPASAIASAFGISLQRVSADPGSPHVPSGPIQLPSELSPMVEAVVGLDNRPKARPHIS